MSEDNANQEILNKYNEIKQKYTLFFQKALEIEEELREHNLVANTLTTVEGNRRCWRMIGGVLVEKDLETIRKDLDIQIANIKQTLAMVNQTLKSQDGVMKEFESKYPFILQALNKQEKREQKAGEQGKSGGGVLA